MADEQQELVVTVEGHRVEVFLRNLFDSDARLLVVPCSISGSIAPDFAVRLDALGIVRPNREFEPGEVVELPSADRRQTILLAAVVAADGPTEQLVLQAARRVGELAVRIGDAAIRPGGTVFPLLGSGAGLLSPENSLRAIAVGFGDGRPEMAPRIHVLDKAIFDRLRKLSSTITPEPPSSSSTADPEMQAATSGHAETASATGSASSASPATTSTGTAHEGRREELVPTHTDGPARIDELGRQGFARVLARRIRDARKEEARNSEQADVPRGGAFIVHLHAPWGAGKTSVLNFLADELRKVDKRAGEKRCVVVEFNAWRHQRIEPPWWWLMTALYAGAVRELWKFDKPRAAWLWLRERLWRSKGGWPGYLALLLVAGAVTWAWRAGWFGAAGNEKLFSPDTVKDYVVTAAAIITPALTVWGLLHTMGRWVFTTSARGARRFMANTSDPMRTVQDHLADLTKWIHHDVVVMIDDLDRCKGPYVVELLEGIQTLFRDVPVTYVIAADRDWLADSYAKEYAEFVSAGGGPGRPVGYLFLEKTFQISTGLPQAGKRLNDFWGRILRSANVPGEQELKRARADAGRELAGKTSEEVRAEVLANPGRTPADEQARLETLAIEMVGERAQQQNQHTLEPFQRLLGRDPNPRAMKRLVNAYGIARGIETLQEVNLADNHLQEQQTALWTILTLRWPKLAGHLARYPEHLQYVGTPDPPTTIPPDLRPLFADPELHDVVHGNAGEENKVEAALTPEFLTETPLR
ncbi:KAP family P-loop NTPase fold protein [Kribbella ginsengisoli]|uniref:KAP NTPase domain-containing protein n=1 Tax=Kribbella ginsengisoli TaxID=363865 RepID=A0ABP6X669_9ACTN